MGSYKSLKYLIPYFKKHIKVLIPGILIAIISSLVYIPIPILIGNITDDIFLKTKNINEFYNIILLITGLYIAKYLMTVVAKLLIAIVEKNIIQDYRVVLMEKIINLPMIYFNEHDKGYIQGRIAECKNISAIFSPNILSVLISLLEAGFSLISIIILNLELSFVTIILIPLFFISTSILSQKLTQKSQEMLETEAELNKESFEIINGVEDIKILNGKENHINRYTDKIRKVTKSAINFSKTLTLFVENTQLINYLGTMLILLISGIMILHNDLTIGLYTAFAAYSSKIIGSIQSFSTLGSIIKPVCVSIERLQELINIPNEDETATQNIYIIEKIDLVKVDFKYSETDKVLISNINSSIKKGDRVNIKGQNGVGKSTLIKLLMGLYAPTNGEILINNININKIHKTSLRNHIGIVSQRIFLFNGSVCDNILYGNNNKTRKDIEHVINKYNFEEYISRFPDGLDTILTQNAGISGGQSQFIAFIRTILSYKDILIFDEPYSNIDEYTKILFKDTFKLLENNIIFIISHETEGLDFINKDIVLDKKYN